LSPVMTPEVWLSPLNCMSYFGILTFLMLFEKKDSLNFKKINPFILFLSGLSGPYSFVLWPLYCLKYFINFIHHFFNLIQDYQYFYHYYS
jgi:hypothetical protein